MTITGQYRFTAIGDHNFLNGKLRKKRYQQISARKMLQAFMRMVNSPADIHLLLEKAFRFCYLPYTQLRFRINLYRSY